MVAYITWVTVPVIQITVEEDIAEDTVVAGSTVEVEGTVADTAVVVTAADIKIQWD